MKTSELTGARLDYWVAQAEGYELDEDGDNRTIRENGGGPSRWNPSTDWVQASAIIERERISIVVLEDGSAMAFVRAEYGSGEIYGSDAEVDGPTALVAAMRAYVASKFGDDVPEVGS